MLTVELWSRMYVSLMWKGLHLNPGAMIYALSGLGSSGKRSRKLALGNLHPPPLLRLYACQSLHQESVHKLT